MNFEICKEFKENFYEVHMFNGLSETKLINLKSSWVFKTISKNNKDGLPNVCSDFLILCQIVTKFLQQVFMKGM